MLPQQPPHSLPDAVVEHLYSASLSCWQNSTTSCQWNPRCVSGLSAHAQAWPGMHANPESTLQPHMLAPDCQAENAVIMRSMTSTGTCRLFGAACWHACAQLSLALHGPRTRTTGDTTTSCCCSSFRIVLPFPARYAAASNTGVAHGVPLCTCRKAKRR